MPRALALLGLERVEEAGGRDRGARAPLRGGGAGARRARRATARRGRSFAKEKGDAGGGRAALRRVPRALPDQLVVVDEAIDFYDEQRRFDRSLEILRAALDGGALGERVPERSRSCGCALRARHEEAERLLREATEVEHPALAAGAWVDLAGYYVEREDYAGGRSACERALESARSRARSSLFAYADALVMAGRYERALEVAREMTVPAHRELVRGRVAPGPGRAGRGPRALRRGSPALARQRRGPLLRGARGGASRRLRPRDRGVPLLDPGRPGRDRRAACGWRASTRPRAPLRSALEALRHDVAQTARESRDGACSSCEIAARLGRIARAGPSRTLVELIRRRRSGAGRSRRWPPARARAAGPRPRRRSCGRADRLDLTDPRARGGAAGAGGRPGGRGRARRGARRRRGRLSRPGRTSPRSTRSAGSRWRRGGCRRRRGARRLRARPRARPRERPGAGGPGPAACRSRGCRGGARPLRARRGAADPADAIAPAQRGRAAGLAGPARRGGEAARGAARASIPTTAGRRCAWRSFACSAARKRSARSRWRDARCASAAGPRRKRYSCACRARKVRPISRPGSRPRETADGNGETGTLCVIDFSLEPSNNLPQPWWEKSITQQRPRFPSPLPLPRYGPPRVR